MNELKLITPEQIDNSAKALDNLVDFTKIIKNKAVGAGAELLDGKAFKIALIGINNLVSEHIPDEYKDEFQTALSDILDGDKDFRVASDQFFDIATQLIVNLEIAETKPYIMSGVNVIIEMLSTFVNLKLEDLIDTE